MRPIEHVTGQLRIGALGVVKRRSAHAKDADASEQLNDEMSWSQHRCARIARDFGGQPSLGLPAEAANAVSV